MKAVRFHLDAETEMVEAAAAEVYYLFVPVVFSPESYGLAAQELRELLDVAVDHADEIERYWNEHFAG